jgi:hypothetical protein
MLVRINHIASAIVNVDHGVMRSAEELRVFDWTRVGSQIDAAMIAARTVDDERASGWLDRMVRPWRSS